MVAIDRHAAVFSALGDATRLALFQRLGDGEALSITALAAGTELSRQAVRKHLDVLDRAGLVEGERAGREHLYRATPGPLEDAADWFLAWRRGWEQSLDRLDAYLHSLPPEDAEP